MDFHIEGGRTCGYHCPECHHCDATVVEWDPITEVRFLLRCDRCSHEWWQR